MALVPMIFFDNAVADIFRKSLARWEDDLADPAGFFQMALTNTTPNPATDLLFTDIPEIPRVNGYFTGQSEHSGDRYDIDHDILTVGKTSTMTAIKIEQQAAGGSIGPFRYMVMYGGSVTPDRPLVCFWDHGSEVTILDGFIHTFFFNGSPNVGTVFTGFSL